MLDVPEIKTTVLLGGYGTVMGKTQGSTKSVTYEADDHSSMMFFCVIPIHKVKQHISVVPATLCG
jgi:hypothetical protein